MNFHDTFRPVPVLQRLAAQAFVAVTAASLLGVAAHAAVFNVDSTLDIGDRNPGNGVCAAKDGECTLRAAIEEANALPGMDTVNVPKGTYLFRERIHIDDSLFLVGAGAGATNLDGNRRAPLLRARTLAYLVCDSTHNAVLSFDSDGMPNRPLVAAGAGGLDLPSAALIGPDGSLYVTGFRSGIHRYDAATGASLGLFTGATAASDIIVGPRLGDGSRSFIVTRYQPGGGIRKYDYTGRVLGIFGAVTDAGPNLPDSLAFNREVLHVTSTATHSVLKYDVVTGALLGTLVPAASGGLNRPRGLLFLPDGTLLVASENTDSVLRYHATSGAFLGAFVPSGSGGLDQPADLALGPRNTLLVNSQGTRQILKYDIRTGAPRGVFVAGDAGLGLDAPSCILPVEGTGRGPVVNISGVTLRNGVASSGDRGAALDNDVGVMTTLTRVVVRDNTSSTFGGGIFNGGTLDLVRTEVRNNALPEGGGGVTSTGGGIFNFGVLSLDQSSVTENFATRGGGIANQSGDVYIRNSTISSNRALGGGGGLRNAGDGNIWIAFSTITLNRANESDLTRTSELSLFGGGILNIDTGRIAMGATILASNTDSPPGSDVEPAPDCYSPTPFKLTSHGSNLIGVINDNCARGDLPPGFDLAGTPAMPLSPVLSSLGDHGGATRMHRLYLTSPAIDGKRTGTSAEYFRCSSVPVDQRGSPRPQDGDRDGTAVCDIGSYELDPLP